MVWNLLRQLRVEDSYETRRRRFFVAAKRTSLAFVVGGLVGATETLWAVRYGSPGTTRKARSSPKVPCSINVGSFSALPPWAGRCGLCYTGPAVGEAGRAAPVGSMTGWAL
jgi:hypothetical protein